MKGARDAEEEVEQAVPSMKLEEQVEAASLGVEGCSPPVQAAEAVRPRASVARQLFEARVPP